MTKYFVCAICRGKFEDNSDQSEEERIEELRKEFGEDVSPEDCGVVCDDCYEKVLNWKNKGGEHEAYGNNDKIQM